MTKFKLPHKANKEQFTDEGPRERWISSSPAEINN